MQRNILLFVGLLNMVLIHAQVGVGTSTSKTTLELVGKSSEPSIADGLICPRLTGDQLRLKDTQYTDLHDGTIVYVSKAVSVASGKARNVNTAGYYFYDSQGDGGVGLWISFVDSGKQMIYIPTMLLPTDSYTLPSTSGYSFSNDVFSVNLYSIYKNQLTSPQAKSNSSSLEYNGNYYYFILYYDTSVFKNVSVSTVGVLSYSLINGYFPSEKTFMNIVILEK